MKVLLIGANRRVGASDKGKGLRSYDMCSVNYLVLDKNAEKSADDKGQFWRYQGIGYAVRELACDPKVLDGLEVPKVELVTLTLEPQPDYPAKNWVVGISK